MGLDGSQRAVTSYTKDLTRALKRKEKSAAIQVLETAVQEGLPVPAVWSEVFIPALTGLGRSWLSGRLSERQFERISRLACRVETEFRLRESAQGQCRETLLETGIILPQEEPKIAPEYEAIVVHKSLDQIESRVSS